MRTSLHKLNIYFMHDVAVVDRNNLYRSKQNAQEERIMSIETNRIQDPLSRVFIYKSLKHTYIHK